MANREIWNPIRMIDCECSVNSIDYNATESEQVRWAVATSYKDTEGAMKNSYRRSFNGSVQLVYNLKNVIFKNYTSLGMVRSQESNFGKFSDYVAQIGRAHV